MPEHEADQGVPAGVPMQEIGISPQVIESTSLFGAGTEVVIRHNGRDYRLRLTRLGKLILTA